MDTGHDRMDTTGRSRPDGHRNPPFFLYSRAPNGGVSSTGERGWFVYRSKCCYPKNNNHQGLGCAQFPCLSLVTPGDEENDEEEAVYTRTIEDINPENIASFLQDVTDKKVSIPCP